jgi:hypothetical protein
MSCGPALAHPSELGGENAGLNPSQGGGRDRAKAASGNLEWSIGVIHNWAQKYWTYPKI